jgi:hypothetical protein
MRKSFIVIFIISFSILLLISFSSSQYKTCYVESCIDQDYSFVLLDTFYFIDKRFSGCNQNFSCHSYSAIGSYGFPLAYLNKGHIKDNPFENYSVMNVLLNLAIAGIVAAIISWGVNSSITKYKGTKLLNRVV